MNKVFKSVWIDMDNTLMDWSKGNTRKALIDIEEPKYYLGLKPTSKDLIYYLQELKYYNISLNIISGIPDYINCDYVPHYRYSEYYIEVCRYKRQTIDRYFPDIFTNIHFLIQSKSKAKFVRDNYNIDGSALIDDMDFYINEWMELINHNAYKVSDQIGCSDYLEYILDEVERKW